MKKIFVTYGDGNYASSLVRIRQEAERVGVFDEVLCYTPDDLPQWLRDYALAHPRGSGYWMWKPWIINDALGKAGPDGIVAYADAGCTLYPHHDWQRYIRLLKTKKGVFFIAPGKNKRWCKRAVIDHFGLTPCLWQAANQIQATFMMVRRNDVIDTWCSLITTHPELFADSDADERTNEYPGFRDHRHDQAVLSACVCTSTDYDELALLPEKLEAIYAEGQAVCATRLSEAGSHSPHLHPRGRFATLVSHLFLWPWLVARTKFLYTMCRRCRK